MARYFITNKKTVEGVGVPAEYDYAGNTRVLSSGERIEVSFDEAQTAVARLRDGLVYEEVSDVAIQEAATAAAEEAVATLPAPAVAEAAIEAPKAEEKPAE